MALKGKGVNYWCFLQPCFIYFLLFWSSSPLCACPYLTRASLSSGAIRATCRFASKCMSAVRPQISINCVSSWALAERGPVFVQNTHTEPEKQRREQWYLTNTSADALMYICALKRELDSSCAACLHRSTWEQDMLTVGKAFPCGLFIGLLLLSTVLYHSEAQTS